MSLTFSSEVDEGERDEMNERSSGGIERAVACERGDDRREVVDVR